jgi:hypothetical protein
MINLHVIIYNYTFLEFIWPLLFAFITNLFDVIYTFINLCYTLFGPKLHVLLFLFGVVFNHY